MDPVRNPFAPGAGNPPPELAGRKGVLDDINVALQRIALGKPSRSSILVGLRGVGKTVLLVKAQSLAEDHRYKTISVEAHEGKSLPELLVPGLKQVLNSLSLIEGAKEQARRGLRVMRGFLNGLSVKVNDVQVGLGVSPEEGVADSGDLEADLPELLLVVANAARSAGRPVAILIDELQYLSRKEFSALIMSVHKISQTNLPLTLIGAGLPQILGLAGESKSYAERLFRYPQIGALDPLDAAEAIRKPIESEGAKINDDALALILEVTERYPYFIQQWSHDSWNYAKREKITAKDVSVANDVSIKALDENFFKVRFDRCTSAEKRYMRALADFGPGTHKSGEIADRLGTSTSNVGPTRDKLIKKGMVYSPSHGEIAFTVPLFDAYMRRVMPAMD